MQNLPKVIILLLTLCFASVVLAAQTIHVGLYSLEPLLSFETTPGGFVGSTVHKQLIKMKDFEVRYHHYPFARLLSMLERKEIDVALLVAKTKERESVYDYGSEALWVSRPALVLKSTSNLIPLKSLEQLRKKKIGHARGSIIPDELSNLEIEWFFRSEDNYFQNALRSIYLERLDGFFVPTLAFAKHEMRSLQDTRSYRLVPLPMPGLPLYTVYPKGLSPAKKNAVEAAIHLAQQELQSMSKELIDSPL